jgi:hypothetical protein
MLKIHTASRMPFSDHEYHRTSHVLLVLQRSSTEQKRDQKHVTRGGALFAWPGILMYGAQARITVEAEVRNQ